MNVWHLTPETPREPSRVTPGSPVHLHIGTWPIEPGQAVAVEFSVTPWSGRMAAGHAQARWVENRGENSHGTATFGPFADGDGVHYRVVGTVRGERVATEWASMAVRPAIHLALLWHHHQPLYRDVAAPPDGAYRFPWVRLHALRDYFGMAYLLAQYPGACDAQLLAGPPLAAGGLSGAQWIGPGPAADPEAYQRPHLRRAAGTAGDLLRRR
ncbi:MAG: hypothetical protein ACRERE_03370 [Candidatus Entotheonellia bacterium]